MTRLLAQHCNLAVVVVADIATAVREHLLGPCYRAPGAGEPCAVLNAVTTFDINRFHYLCPFLFLMSVINSVSNPATNRIEIDVTSIVSPVLMLLCF